MLALRLKKQPPLPLQATMSAALSLRLPFDPKLDWHVQIVRKLRDNRLLTNRAGRGIVNLYYRLSPVAADYLKQHPLARVAVRYGLIPITSAAYVALYVHPVASLFGFILLLVTKIHCPFVPQ